MYIRFLENQNTIYELDFQQISDDVIQLSGTNLPEDEYLQGFEIVDYNENNELYVVNAFGNYNVIYDCGDQYIQYTSDSNMYYNYLIYDANCGFVVSIEVRPDQEVVNGYLIQCGQGKAYREFSYELFDADGFYLYKVFNDELLNTSPEEKNAFFAGKKHTFVFEDAKANKFAEINMACNHYIEEGIDYNGSHYSFSNDDQKNFTTLMKFVEMTKLSVPYHADGESCRAFSPEEFTTIYALQNYNLMHHTSYANQLKLYVNTLTTPESIYAVEYGQPLTGEYLDTYNEMIAMTKALAEQSLGVNALNL